MYSSDLERQKILQMQDNMIYCASEGCVPSRNTEVVVVVVVIIIIIIIIITCLTTMYKTLTVIIAKKIYTHLEEKSLLPAGQKGCHTGSKGCKINY
jgi:ABC-type protease/lipase transport system fused ATPase/permease subunit